MPTSHSIDPVFVSRTRRFLAAISAPVLALAPASAQCEEAELEGVGLRPEAAFGGALCLDGNRLLTGARLDGWSQRGSAFVHRRTLDGWRQEARLLAPDAQSGDEFGRSVALEAGRALVGAPGRVGGGIAFAFRESAGTWRFDGVLDAPETEAGDELGAAVSLSGPLAAVAAPYHDAAGPDAGAVWIFEHLASGWIPRERLLPPQGGPGVRFGSSVALHGTTLIVGAPGDDEGGPRAGAVWVFELPHGGTAVHQKLRASNARAGDAFGLALDLDAEAGRLAVGAPREEYDSALHGRAYVFELTGGAWNEAAALDGGSTVLEPVDFFGSAVALDDDRLLVSSLPDDDSGPYRGRVQLFSLETGTWLPALRFEAPTTASSDLFGAALCLLGETAAVGEPTGTPSVKAAGTVYQYDLSCGDCNGNGVDDGLDIATGTSRDCDGDGVPDECIYGDFARAIGRCAQGAPCGNLDPEAGCANSTGAGASLGWCRSSSILADELVLDAKGMPPGVAAQLFMGGSALAPTPFGDGLRCVGSGASGIHRYPLRASDANGALLAGPGLVAFSRASFSAPGWIQPGSTWHFQVWYRDPSGPCTGGFNLTDGLRVHFVP